VTVSTGGVITGLNFIPGTSATMTSPASVPLHLLALEQAANPGVPGDLAVGGDSATRVTSDAQLRTAIVNVAGYYLRLAKTKTPAQMEALIWGDASSDGADHGPSCAAFASLTLELAAQTVGLQSWASGGDTYPWPLHEWADVRVQTNPDSPAIMSMQADAQQHGRWHPLGDSYQPQPGDWAIYDGHVEVVTSYANGVLDTIGADSLPNLTVNAHSSAAPLAEQGVQGFIDNGNLPPAAGSLGASAPTGTEQATPTQQATAPATQRTSNAKVPTRAAAKPSTQRPAATQTSAGYNAAVPGLPGASALSGTGGIPGTDAAPVPGSVRTAADAAASIPGLQAVSASPSTMDAPGTAVIPGASAAVANGTPSTRPAAHASAPSNVKPAPSTKPSAPATSAPSSSSGSTSHGSSANGSQSNSNGSSGRQYATPGTRNQQAFISLVAPGAVAAQQRYGVPASVTIAQAIEESAWGQSGLAAQYHNLFGVKGTGTAGSVSLPTSEFEGGHWVTVDAAFRVYHNDAESIADHAELLATSGYYTRAMGDRAIPDAFANALTGVYATDPNYGANLIALMKLYNLYQYDASPAAAPAPTVSHTPSAPAPSQTPTPTPTQPTTPTTPAASPSPSATTQQTATPDASPTSSPSSSPVSTPTAQPSSGATGQAATGQTGPSAAPAATTGSAGQIPGLVSPGPVTSGATAPSHVTPAKRPAARRAPASGASASASATASSGSASIPGAFAPGTGISTSANTGPSPAANARVPGVRAGAATQAAARQTSSRPVNVVTASYVTPGRPTTEQAAIGHVTPGRGTAQRASTGAAWYEQQLPHTVATALFASAKGPLARGEHLYRDVAACTNVSWKLLAAVDWMQCKADPRYSPVQGEKLGARNNDGTSYSTKSAALTQCACDLLELSAAVYGIDLTARRPLSVRELAAAFAAFRWGAILWRHGVSPMEFPYSVAGLTAQHQKMHWPSIDAPDAPDRPGARFREQFGAVPVVLSLGYPATV